MMMLARLFTLAVAVLVLTGCGEVSYLLLEIDAELDVPTEVNGLELLVHDHPSDPNTAQELFTTVVTLQPDENFPRRVLLQPSSEQPQELVITVTALFDQTPVATATAFVPWTAGADNLVTFPLLEPL